MAWTLPSVVADGQTITAAHLNTIRTALSELQGYTQELQSWSSPINGGITIGNGTVSAFYQRTGRLTKCWFFFQMGSTSAITTSVDLTLPFTAVAAAFINGHGRLLDSSTGDDFEANVFGISTTVARVGPLGVATDVIIESMSATNPLPWAQNDTIAVVIDFLAVS